MKILYESTFMFERKDDSCVKNLIQNSLIIHTVPNFIKFEELSFWT